MGIWNILRTFGIFCVHWEHFSGFGIMHQEKSGNPAEWSATFWRSLWQLLMTLCRPGTIVIISKIFSLKNGVLFKILLVIYAKFRSKLWFWCLKKTPSLFAEVWLK
jgi:hypothetical protein